GQTEDRGRERPALVLDQDVARAARAAGRLHDALPAVAHRDLALGEGVPALGIELVNRADDLRFHAATFETMLRSLPVRPRSRSLESLTSTRTDSPKRSRSARSTSVGVVARCGSARFRLTTTRSTASCTRTCSRMPGRFSKAGLTMRGLSRRPFGRTRWS